MKRQVKVLILSSPPSQSFLEFTLIFDDGYEKYYKLDEYGLAFYRGSGELDIIEDLSRAYYEEIGEPAETIELIIY